MPSLQATSAIRGLKSAMDAYRDALALVNSSHFRKEFKRFTDFVINMALLDALNHPGRHSTQPLSFDPQAKGDRWASLTAVVKVPALQRNSGGDTLVGRAADAYYVNNAGIRLFQEVTVRSGNVDGHVLTHQDLFMHYQMHDEYASDVCDPRIHRFSSLSQLKQFSAANCTWTVPLYDSQYRFNRLHSNFHFNASLRQAVEFKVRLASLVDITVNETNTSLLPYKYGTSTPLASDDVQIQFYSHFLIMSSEERNAQKQLWQSSSGHHVPITYPQTFTYKSPASEVAGTEIRIPVNPNHAISGFYLFFQPDSYIDGSRVSPQGVGLKNWYDYSAPLGGHTIGAIDMLWNGSSFLDKTHPVNWTLSSWQQFHETLHKKPFSTIYPVSFATKMDGDYPDKTINLSNVDRIEIVVNKNVSEAGTFYIVFLTQNVFSYKSGFATQIFA